jgi:hypothetical protein
MDLFEELNNKGPDCTISDHIVLLSMMVDAWNEQGEEGDVETHMLLTNLHSELSKVNVTYFTDEESKWISELSNNLLELETYLSKQENTNES